MHQCSCLLQCMSSMTLLIRSSHACRLVHMRPRSLVANPVMLPSPAAMALQPSPQVKKWLWGLQFHLPLLCPFQWESVSAALVVRVKSEWLAKWLKP